VDNYYPYGYYNSHQIVRSHYARRWQHNPYHRRGAVYRSRAVTHRYNSNRPPRGERYSSRSTIVGRANSASGYDSVTRNIRNRQYNAVIRPNTRQRRIQSELTERSRVQSNLRENVQRDINRESGHSVSSQDRRNNSGNRHSSRNNRSNIVRGNNRTFTGSGAGRQRTQPIVIREPKIRQEVQSSPPPSRSSYRPPEPRRESRSSSRSYNASPRSFNSNRSSSSRGQRAFRGGNRSHGGGARQRH